MSIEASSEATLVLRANPSDCNHTIIQHLKPSKKTMHQSINKYVISILSAKMLRLRKESREI